MVYADNDPIVLAHARALLVGTDQGRTAYVEADITKPEALLTAPQLTDALDLGRPIGLSLNAVLHFVTDAMGAGSLVEHFKAALAPGSSLAVSHLTPDFAPVETEHLVRVYTQAGTPVQARGKARVHPVLRRVGPRRHPARDHHRWRPDDARGRTVTDRETSGYAAVALKP